VNVPLQYIERDLLFAGRTIIQGLPSTFWTGVKKSSSIMCRLKLCWGSATNKVVSGVWNLQVLWLV
jgi:hypothetical protein